MPDLPLDVITWLGLLVLVVTLGSPRLYGGLTDSSPETVPGSDNDAAEDPAPPRAEAGEGPARCAEILR